MNAGAGAALIEALGELVREKRRTLGLSQEALASLCDLDRTYISSIERYRGNVSLQTLSKLAHALNTEPPDFLVQIGTRAQRPRVVVEEE
jgi:transcriptional regulator with XRE-family HTH domain